MKAVKNLVVVTGEWTNAAGETKKRYMSIGKLFKRDDGNFAIKLDSIPLGAPGWTGWVSMFDIDEKTETAAAPSQQGSAVAAAPAKVQMNDDDLPF